MKIIQFKIPVTQAESIIVSEDVLPFFYNHFHRHKEMQLTLILRGEGTLVVGNYSQSFKPGDLYIIGANQPHILKSDENYCSQAGLDNVHAVHIFIEPEIILQNLIILPEMEFLQKFLEHSRQGLQVPREYTPEASKMVLKISRASGLKRLISFIKLVRYFSKNLNSYKSLATGFAHAPATEPKDTRMSKIYQYTLAHYAEDITLERIASVVHITPHAFCKYFKKHTFKTYKTFLNEVRINEACKKIINGDFECISSIAYATGFNSAINFNKVFKKTTGKCPSEYIREYKHKWNDPLTMLRQPA